MSELTERAEEKKKFKKEDILTAENTGEVLEVYRRVLENSADYEKVGLQTAIADRLHQLGDEDKSFQFTILASQTENNQNIRRSVEVFVDVSTELGRSANGILGASENFKNSTDKMNEGLEELRLTGSRISSASTQMEKAAGDIDGAARSIEQSSNRMAR
jgi:methyl-accepting chemotaxis protein